MTRPGDEGVTGYLTTSDGVRLFYRRIGHAAQTAIVPNGIVYFAEFKHLARDRSVIFFDVRNRGLSDTVTDEHSLARGIRNDVDDLDAVRRHFRLKSVDVVGHSYQGMTVILYAMQYPAFVNRIVQIAPVQPFAGTAYPRVSGDTDTTLADVMAKLAAWRSKPPPPDPVMACEGFWSILRAIYVVNPADAGQIDWGRCDLANERNALTYLNQWIFPSIQALGLSEQKLSTVTHPVLIVHGRKDRSVPYEAARDWARFLGNGRLLTVDGAAHAPWIEAPEMVFGAIHTFLNGAWPEGVAERKKWSP